MKRLLTIFMLFPFLAIGQTKLSQLPAATPDASTSLVGLKNVGGVYTDYLFPFSSLGAGTVSSVGLSMPLVFSVSPTSITSSGTFSVVAAGGQAANRFYATPNGISGALGLRSIVAADLPTVGTPGIYGDATHVPVITTDAFGRVSAASSASLGAIATVTSQFDQPNIVGAFGSPIASTGALSTLVVTGYININNIATDVLYYVIQWTDENGIAQAFQSPHFSTIGFYNIGPLTIRVNAGTIVALNAILFTSGGTINYDLGWKVIQ